MTWLIARYTFLSIVRSRSFLIAIFGLPILLLLWMLGTTLVGVLVASSLREKLAKPIAVQDDSDVFRKNPNLLGGMREGELRILKVPVDQKEKEKKKKLKEKFGRKQSFDFFGEDDESVLENVAVRLVSDEVTGKDLLQRGEVEVFIRFPFEFEKTGKYYSFAAVNRSAANFSSRLDQIAKDAILERAGLNEAIRQSVLFDFGRESQKLKEGEFHELQEDESNGLIYKILLAIALILPMGAAASYGLSSSLSQESESKLADVFLSSVTVKELLLGKVIGGSAADLLTVLSWGALVTLLAGMGLGLDKGPVFLISGPGVFLGVIFSALGLLQYHLMGAFLGSVGGRGASNNRLVQWVARIVSLIPIAAVIFGIFNPDGALLELFSFIPPFSAAVMIPRLVMSEVQLWAVTAALAVNVTFIWLEGEIAARTYRAFLLMRGQPKSISRFVQNFRSA